MDNFDKTFLLGLGVIWLICAPRVCRVWYTTYMKDGASVPMAVMGTLGMCILGPYALYCHKELHE